MVVLEGRIVTHDNEWYGQVRSTEEGLELGKPGRWLDCIKLPESQIIIPGIHDVHVHPRDGPTPTLVDYERQRLIMEQKKDSIADYAALAVGIDKHRQKETLVSMSSRALLGGVCRVGCHLNIPWRPFTEERFAAWMAYATERSRIPTVGYPVIDDGTLPFDTPLAAHEYKDFGATFGGKDVTRAQTRSRRAHYAGCHVSYHTEATEGLPPFDGKQSFHEWLGPQYEILAIKDMIEQDHEIGFKRVTHMHVSTAEGIALVAEAFKQTGRHYAQFTMDHVLLGQDNTLHRKEWAYRRPPLRTDRDRQALFELIALNPPWLMYGSDHAPHTASEKEFKDGRPGSPGTPCLELTGHFFADLHNTFHVPLTTLVDLFCHKPACWLGPVSSTAQRFGVVEDGAAPYLSVIDLGTPTVVDERQIAACIGMPAWSHYHRYAFTGKARGVVLKDRFYEN